MDSEKHRKIKARFSPYPLFTKLTSLFYPSPFCLPFRVAQDDGEWGVAVSPYQFLSPASFSSHFSSASAWDPSYKVKFLRDKTAPVWALQRPQFPSRNIHGLQSVNVLHCGPSQAVGNYLPHQDSHRIAWRTSSPSFFSHLSTCTAVLSSLFSPLLRLLDIFKCPFLNKFSRGTNILADGLSCVLWWLTLELAGNWLETSASRMGQALTSPHGAHPMCRPSNTRAPDTQLENS